MIRTSKKLDLWICEICGTVNNELRCKHCLAKRGKEPSMYKKSMRRRHYKEGDRK